jgi:hypothetical protein
MWQCGKEGRTLTFLWRSVSWPVSVARRGIVFGFCVPSRAKTPLVFGKNAVGLWIEAWTLGHFFTAGTKVGYCTPSTLFAGRST